MFGSWAKSTALGLMFIGHVTGHVVVRSVQSAMTTTSSVAAACSTPVIPPGCTTTASGLNPATAYVDGNFPMGTGVTSTVLSGTVTGICAGGDYSLTIPYVVTPTYGYLCFMAATLGGSTLSFDSKNIYAHFSGGSSSTLPLSITVDCTNALGNANVAAVYTFSQGQVSLPYVAAPCGGASTSSTTSVSSSSLTSTSSTSMSSTTASSISTTTTATSSTTTSIPTSTTSTRTITTTTAVPGTTCTAVANAPGFITCGGHGYPANEGDHYLSPALDASSRASPAACYEVCLKTPGCVLIGFIQDIQCEFYNTDAAGVGFTAARFNSYSLWDAACFSCDAPSTTTSTTITSTLPTTTTTATTASTTAATTSSSNTSTTSSTSTQPSTTSTSDVPSTSSTSITSASSTADVSTSISALSTSSSTTLSSMTSTPTLLTSQSSSTSSSTATSTVASSATSDPLTTSTITATNIITISTCAPTIINCPYTSMPITTVSITTYTTVCPVATAIPTPTMLLTTLTNDATKIYTITVSTIYTTSTSTISVSGGKVTTLLVPVGTTTFTINGILTTPIPAQSLATIVTTPSSNPKSGISVAPVGPANTPGTAVGNGTPAAVTVGSAGSITTSGSLSTSTGLAKVAAGCADRFGFSWLGSSIAIAAAMML